MSSLRTTTATATKETTMRKATHQRLCTLFGALVVTGVAMLALGCVEDPSAEENADFFAFENP